MSPIIRAIDVGFGNTKYVVASNDGKVECAHFPSLAFHSAHEPTTNGLGGKRKTVAIPIDGNFYEVGPEVELAANPLRVRRQHDKYSETDEYRALTAGALHYMKVETVDVLVLGLPVAHYIAKRALLEKSMTGVFDVGRKRQVQVKKVVVMAQPQGALFHFATKTGRIKEVMDSRSLVIDVGGRTFDWLVTLGTRPMPRQSDSVDRGVRVVCKAIAESISEDIGEQYTDLEAIDQALRTGKGLKVFQKPYDLKRFDKTIQNITEGAVDLMGEKLENSYAFDNVVLAGGGAYLYKKALKKRFPRLAIQEIPEPMYANVRGYQLFGEQYMREMMATQAASPAAGESRAQGDAVGAA